MLLNKTEHSILLVGIEPKVVFMLIGTAFVHPSFKQSLYQSALPALQFATIVSQLSL